MLESALSTTTLCDFRTNTLPVAANSGLDDDSHGVADLVVGGGGEGKLDSLREPLVQHLADSKGMDNGPLLSPEVDDGLGLGEVTNDLALEGVLATDVSSSTDGVDPRGGDGKGSVLDTPDLVPPGSELVLGLGPIEGVACNQSTEWELDAVEGGDTEIEGGCTRAGGKTGVANTLVHLLLIVTDGNNEETRAAIFAFDDQFAHDESNLGDAEGGVGSRHELGGLFAGGVKDVTVLGDSGGGFNVECIKTMSTFGKEVDANSIEVEEFLHQRLEVGAVLHVARKGADDETDMGGDDDKHREIYDDDGVQHQVPELGCAVLDILETEVWRNVSIEESRKGM